MPSGRKILSAALQLNHQRETRVTLPMLRYAGPRTDLGNGCEYRCRLRNHLASTLCIRPSQRVTVFGCDLAPQAYQWLWLHRIMAKKGDVFVADSWDTVVEWRLVSP